MSFNEILSLMLPSQPGVNNSSIIHSFGDNTGTGPHGGLDLGYAGNSFQIFPVFSPIAGKVEFFFDNGPTPFRGVAIRDADGNLHKFFTEYSNVAPGMMVNKGDPLGTYNPHSPANPPDVITPFHYEILNAAGHRINPEAWWNKGYDDALQSNAGNSGLAHGLHGAPNLTDTMVGPSGGFAQQAILATQSSFNPPQLQLQFGAFSIDLNNNGLVPQQQNEVVMFNSQNDGGKHAMFWTNPQDGMLTMDRNHNGLIDQASELFSLNENATAGKFSNLAELDSNNDGVINANDAQFNQLHVWIDGNQDGIGDGSENYVLDSLGIKAIDLNAPVQSVNSAPFFEVHERKSVIYNDGHSGIAGQFSPMYFPDSHIENNIPSPFLNKYLHISNHADGWQSKLAPPVEFLPNLHGTGNVNDLWQAASESQELLGAAITFAGNPTNERYDWQLDDLINKWVASTPSLQSQAQAQGVMLRYEYSGQVENGNTYAFEGKLAAVEAFMGFHYSGANGEAQLTTDIQANDGNGSMLVRFQQNTINYIEKAYAYLRKDVFDAFALKSMTFQQINQALESSLASPQADFTAFETALANANYNQQQTAFNFISSYGPDKLQNLGWDAIAYISNAIKHGQVNLEPNMLIGKWQFSFGDLYADQISSRWIMGPAYSNEVQNLRGDNVFMGFEGNDNFVDGKGNDYVYAEAGNDTITTSFGNDTLDGGDGDDILTDNSGNNLFKGGAGNDSIFALTGNATVDGGAGNDFIDLHVDRADYFFGRGDGQDIIKGFAAFGTNVLHFKAGIAPADVVLRMSDNNLLVSLNNGDEQISIENFHPGRDMPGGNLVDLIRFSNGTSWNAFEIMSHISPETENSDFLTYDWHDNFIHALGGDDSIYAGDGQDTVFGDAGNDMLIGEGGNDSIDGGEGDDKISGGWGEDSLVGGSGNDEIHGDDDNDYISGGTGDDILDGGSGHNIYSYSLGDGHDTLLPGNNYSSYDNFLKLHQYQREQLQAKHIGNDLVLSFGNASDSITLSNFFSVGVFNTNNTPLQIIEFDNGIVLNQYELIEMTMKGTEGNDNIVGLNTDDFLHGFGGDDTIAGGQGNDQIFGDTGNDELSGGMGADMLEGGQGNDRISGGEGFNTIKFNLGDGVDTLVYNAEDQSFFTHNVLELGSQINAADVSLQRQGDSLVVSFNAVTPNSDGIIVEKFFAYNVPSNPESQLQEIRFADGSQWDTQAILNRYLSGTNTDDVLQGTIQNENIAGQGGNDKLYGDQGNDSLDGGLGNDTLDGGQGDDQLTGGKGNNTYQFGRGDGTDNISASTDTTPGKTNILKLDADVSVGDVVLSRVGNALKVSIASTGDSITAQGYFAYDNPLNPTNSVQKIVFHDGTSWDYNAVKLRAFAGTMNNDNIKGTIIADQIYGQAGNDILNGRGGNDFIGGGDGNDQLYGEGGNDSLEGGAGNDILEGGYGDDIMNGGTGNNTYIYGNGYGKDVIKSSFDANNARFSELKLKAGISTTNINLSHVGNDLKIGFTSASDTLLIENFYLQDNPSNNQNPVQQMKFADGTLWKLADIVAHVSAPLVVQDAPSTSNLVELVGLTSTSALPII